MTTPNPIADALGITALRKDVADLTDLVRAMIADSRPPEYTIAQTAAAIGESQRRMDELKQQGRIAAGARTIPIAIVDELSAAG